MAEYLYFYSSSSIFSNFFPSKFEDENGNKYTCSEQYFMKKKQEFFDNDNKELGEQIMKATSPAIIKKFGRMVKNYDEKKWNDARYNVMIDALKLKFSKKNKTLHDTLIATGDKILVEASPTDKIWGVGISVDDAKKYGPSAFRGQNLLGKALMDVRKYFNDAK